MAYISPFDLDSSVYSDSSTTHPVVCSVPTAVSMKLAARKTCIQQHHHSQENVPDLNTTRATTDDTDEDAIHWSLRSANRNVNREETFCRARTPPPALAGDGVPAPPQPNQESSWMGVFSVVSRPALAFLQKYLPVRPRSPALPDSIPLSGWVNGDFRHNLVEAESAFWGQFNNMPESQANLQYQPGNTKRAVSGISTPSWLAVESLSELGIQNEFEMDPNIRHQSPVGSLAALRGILSHVLLNAPEIKVLEQRQFIGGDRCTSETLSTRPKSMTDSNWWGGLWGTDDSAQGWLSNLQWGKEKPGVNHYSDGHCFQPESGTKVTVTKPTELFIQRVDYESMDGESPGPTHYKEDLMDNGSLQAATELASLPSHWKKPGIRDNLVIIGAATSCSEVAVLTPDLDNGYSSLEEEHAAVQMYMRSPHFEEVLGITEIREETDTPETPRQTVSVGSGPEPEASEQGIEGEMPASGLMEGEQEEEEEEDESDITDSEEDEEEARFATPPQCSNKAIAYIMGSPCSDDSQSDSSLSDDDDDDGFDSEGSSEFSDPESTEDDEDDGSDSERADSETERLWNSLCQSKDPYNPQNFTATLHTTPRNVPSTSTATPAFSPNVSPREHPPSCLSSFSPEEEFGSEDESCDSDVDEAESLRLWNSFASSADPYSPLNFQAPFRTQEQAGATSCQLRSCKPSPQSLHHGRGQTHSAPQYRSEEAEERLDSGFSETHTPPEFTAVACKKVKQVRFQDEVQEFYTCEDNEDRRGPWEELARDRCRFRRRVHEISWMWRKDYIRAPAYTTLITTSPTSSSSSGWGVG
ncbi:hypothetical protein DPEC_G00195190 [Dallia pectoralis]|uniref:Uncharacterized protein n=1 Tax=Dallia pectoralis TaxID=75939 RepID=A0ACC2G7K3_DALPE|nr:hypothetical protein DPEC_G00195190 [Dallia pectoralis]